MLPAEEAHWVYDLVHLLQRHPVHQLVQLMKSILDLSVRHGVALAVGFIEQGQDGIRVPQIWGMGVQAAAQGGQVFGHKKHLLKSLCDVTSDWEK